MLNWFWKAGYNLSTIAPILVLASVLDGSIDLIHILLALIGLLIIIIGLLLPRLSRKYLERRQILVESVSPNDNFYEYLLSYTLPLLPVILQYDFLWTLLIIGILCMLLTISNKCIPNPFLRVMGYHFYTISIKDGFSGYTLIHKGVLESKNNLHSGYLAAQFLIIGGDENEQ